MGPLYFLFKENILCHHSCGNLLKVFKEEGVVVTFLLRERSAEDCLQEDNVGDRKAFEKVVVGIQMEGEGLS